MAGDFSEVYPDIRAAVERGAKVTCGTLSLFGKRTPGAPTFYLMDGDVEVAKEKGSAASLADTFIYYIRQKGFTRPAPA